MTGSGSDWTDEQYAAAVTAAEEVFKSTARLRRALPWGKSSGDRYVVTGPAISKSKSDDTWSATVSAVPVPSSKTGKADEPGGAPIHVYSDFKLDLNQIGDEDLLRLLAQRAAQDVAANESTKIFEQVVAAIELDMTVKYHAWEDMRHVLNRAVEKLHGHNHLGPNVFVMTPRLHSKYRQLVASNSGRLFLGEALGGDVKDVSVSGSQPESLWRRAGLLISTGVPTVELVEVSPLALTVIEQSKAGWVFRLEERVSVRVVDRTGAVRLDLAANAGEVKGTSSKFSGTVNGEGEIQVKIGEVTLTGRIEGGDATFASFELKENQAAAPLSGLSGYVSRSDGLQSEVKGTITIDIKS